MKQTSYAPPLLTSAVHNITTPCIDRQLLNLTLSLRHICLRFFLLLA